MVQEASVRTFAIGGRPQTGPMQPVGGTKGSLVLQSQYLTGISAYVVGEFVSTRQEARQWQSFLPTGFGINANDASARPPSRPACRPVRQRHRRLPHLLHPVHVPQCLRGLERGC